MAAYAPCYIHNMFMMQGFSKRLKRKRICFNIRQHALTGQQDNEWGIDSLTFFNIPPHPILFNCGWLKRWRKQRRHTSSCPCYISAVCVCACFDQWANPSGRTRQGLPALTHQSPLSNPKGVPWVLEARASPNNTHTYTKWPPLSYPSTWTDWKARLNGEIRSGALLCA